MVSYKCCKVRINDEIIRWDVGAHGNVKPFGNVDHVEDYTNEEHHKHIEDFGKSLPEVTSYKSQILPHRRVQQAHKANLKNKETPRQHIRDSGYAQSVTHYQAEATSM